jgi:hypothetical protein
MIENKHNIPMLYRNIQSTFNVGRDISFFFPTKYIVILLTRKGYIGFF